MISNVYIASGWFTKTQMQQVEKLKKVLASLKIGFFSPKDHNLCNLDASYEKKLECYACNLVAIDSSDLVIVNSQSYDPGAMMELGYAVAKGKRVILFAQGIDKPNLMLAMSCICVCNKLSQVRASLKSLLKDDSWSKKYGGGVI